MSSPWYETLDFADGITRVRERFIDGEVRCNMWHVRGRDRDVLVFVEVKARRAGALVPGYYAVDRRKRKVLRRAARDRKSVV